jgi:hypothetical protein
MGVLGRGRFEEAWTKGHESVRLHDLTADERTVVAEGELASQARFKEVAGWPLGGASLIGLALTDPVVNAVAFTFLVARVHLYFGTEKGATSKRDMNRRSLETYAVARWADLRRRSATPIPATSSASATSTSPKPRPATRSSTPSHAVGSASPDTQPRMGSSIRKDKHYDQIAFFPPSEPSSPSLLLLP